MPLLLGLESFSPSVLISVGTRAEVSTFGRVTKFGDTQSRPWNLRTRTRPSISISNRYLNPVTPVKSKQVNKRVADILVRLFFSDSLSLVRVQLEVLLLTSCGLSFETELLLCLKQLSYYVPPLDRQSRRPLEIYRT